MEHRRPRPGVEVVDEDHPIRGDPEVFERTDTRSAQAAVAELRRCAGAEFDPRVVEALAQTWRTSKRTARRSGPFEVETGPLSPALHTVPRVYARRAPDS